MVAKKIKFWTAAQTHERQELRAAAHVERQGFEFFLPVCEEFRARRFRKTIMFPGYLFVRIREGWQKLASTRGISRLIYNSDGLPSRLSDREIEQLRALEDEHGVVQLRKRVFSDGDLVRVGPGGHGLETLSGIVQGTPVADRYRILFTIMGRQVVGEVDARSLSAA